jgi:hypothetical protein
MMLSTKRKILGKVTEKQNPPTEIILIPSEYFMKHKYTPFRLTDKRTR